MKDYASISDFEINKAVFVKTQYYDDVIDKPVRDGTAVHWGDGCNWREFDPCNNPADAWPIITENKICLIPEIGDGTWWAMYQPIIQLDWRVYDDGKPIENNANPLRAAMIVFLMMKENEND